MSQLVIRESTDNSETSNDSDLEASDWEKEHSEYFLKTAYSKDTIDRRLISVYMMRKAHQQGY